MASSKKTLLHNEKHKIGSRFLTTCRPININARFEAYEGALQRIAMTGKRVNYDINKEFS
jgi:hypothetical protein